MKSLGLRLVVILCAWFFGVSPLCQVCGNPPYDPGALSLRAAARLAEIPRCGQTLAKVQMSRFVQADDKRFTGIGFLDYLYFWLEGHDRAILERRVVRILEYAHRYDDFYRRLVTGFFLASEHADAITGVIPPMICTGRFCGPMQNSVEPPRVGSMHDFIERDPRAGFVAVEHPKFFSEDTSDDFIIRTLEAVTAASVHNLMIQFLSTHGQPPNVPNNHINNFLRRALHDQNLANVLYYLLLSGSRAKAVLQTKIALRKNDEFSMGSAQTDAMNNSHRNRPALEEAWHELEQVFGYSINRDTILDLAMKLDQAINDWLVAAGVRNFRRTTSSRLHTLSLISAKPGISISVDALGNEIAGATKSSRDHTEGARWMFEVALSKMVDRIHGMTDLKTKAQFLLLVEKLGVVGPTALRLADASLPSGRVGTTLIEASDGTFYPILLLERDPLLWSGSNPLQTFAEIIDALTTSLHDSPGTDEAAFAGLRAGADFYRTLTADERAQIPGANEFIELSDRKADLVEWVALRKSLIALEIEAQNQMRALADEDFLRLPANLKILFAYNTFSQLVGAGLQPNKLPAQGSDERVYYDAIEKYLSPLLKPRIEVLKKYLDELKKQWGKILADPYQVNAGQLIRARNAFHSVGVFRELAADCLRLLWEELQRRRWMATAESGGTFFPPVLRPDGAGADVFFLENLDLQLAAALAIPPTELTDSPARPSLSDFVADSMEPIRTSKEQPPESFEELQYHRDLLKRLYLVIVSGDRAPITPSTHGDLTRLLNYARNPE